MSRRTAPSSLRAAWARAGAVAAAVLALDQLVKAMVNAALAVGEERPLFAGIRLVNTRNSGIAFGQLQGGGALVAVLVGLAVAALVTYFARTARRPLMWLPTGMLLGGAAGNIVDRVREGAVVDFVKLPYWPAFNVADAAITIGVVVLLVVMERGGGARASR